MSVHWMLDLARARDQIMAQAKPTQNRQRGEHAIDQIPPKPEQTQRRQRAPFRGGSLRNRRGRATPRDRACRANWSAASAPSARSFERRATPVPKSASDRTARCAYRDGRPRAGGRARARYPRSSRSCRRAGRNRISRRGRRAHPRFRNRRRGIRNWDVRRAPRRSRHGRIDTEPAARLECGQRRPVAAPDGEYAGPRRNHEAQRATRLPNDRKDGGGANSRAAARVGRGKRGSTLGAGSKRRSRNMPFGIRAASNPCR